MDVAKDLGLRAWENFPTLHLSSWGLILGWHLTMQCQTPVPQATGNGPGGGSGVSVGGGSRWQWGRGEAGKGFKPHSCLAIPLWHALWLASEVGTVISDSVIPKDYKLLELVVSVNPRPQHIIVFLRGTPKKVPLILGNPQL